VTQLLLMDDVATIYHRQGSVSWTQMFVGDDGIIE
jgi:hypothetical protein